MNVNDCHERTVRFSQPRCPVSALLEVIVDKLFNFREIGDEKPKPLRGNLRAQVLSVSQLGLGSLWLVERDSVKRDLSFEIDPHERNTPSAWFALHVRTRHEVAVASFLDARGYEPFVPLHENRRPWSDRIKVVKAPLFPGYLFCRFDINNRLPILTTPGVIQIVGSNRMPIPVDEAEISAIKSLVASGLPSRPWPYLHAGDSVRIDSGPLRGLEGLLVKLKGCHRLVVSVTLLQRSVAVEIDSALVKAIRSAPTIHSARAIRAWQLAT